MNSREWRMKDSIYIINMQRLIAYIIFNICLIFYFLYLNDYEIKYTSTLLLIFVYMILFTPIFFVKDVFHPVFVLITIQILPLINFLEKDLIRLPYRFGTTFGGSYNNSVFIYSLTVIAVWYIFLYLGIWFSKNLKKNFYKRIKTIDINHPIFLGTLILLVSMSSYIYILLNIGGIAAIIDAMSFRTQTYAGHYYLLYLVNLGTISAIFYLYGGFKKTSLIIVTLTFFCMATFGSRESAFFSTIFTYLIFYHYYVKKVNLLKLSIIAILAILFGVMWGNLRHYGELSLMGSTNFKELLFEAGRGKLTAEILPPLIGGLISGHIEYKYGSTLLNVFYAPIPSSIWPNKPIINETGIIGEILMGKDAWGLPAREYGVAFLNFGWIGVIVISIITGIIVGLLYNNLLKSKGNSKNYNFWILLIYALTIRGIFNVVSTSAQIDIIWNLIIVTVIYHLNKFLNKTISNQKS